MGCGCWVMWVLRKKQAALEVQPVKGSSAWDEQEPEILSTSRSQSAASTNSHADPDGSHNVLMGSFSGIN